MISRSLNHIALAVVLASANVAAAGESGAKIAQLYNRAPAEDFDDLGPAGPSGPDREAAGLGMRVDRLERELRSMTGRVEELQHAVRLLEEQLRAARPENGARAPGSSIAGEPLAPPTAATPARPVAAAPLHEPGAPLDLTPGLQGQGASAAVPAATEPTPQPSVKDEYDAAVALMRAGQYEAAEKSLTVFLAKYSKSKYAPAATYGLGESFFLRGRYREAAEKYLEISTKHAQSAQAPDAMLRLGQALEALGAREQACASFSEIGVKYPGSAARVRDAAQRESKKLQC